MTDLSTPLQPHALNSPLARCLRLPVTLLKHLFRSRPSSHEDLRHANEHFLKDIGLRR